MGGRGYNSTLNSHCEQGKKNQDEMEKPLGTINSRSLYHPWAWRHTRERVCYSENPSRAVVIGDGPPSVGSVWQRKAPMVETRLWQGGREKTHPSLSAPFTLLPSHSDSASLGQELRNRNWEQRSLGATACRRQALRQGTGWQMWPGVGGEQWNLSGTMKNHQLSGENKAISKGGINYAYSGNINGL